MKYVSILGLTLIITSMTSFSNNPKMGAIVGIIGGLMLLYGKFHKIRSQTR